TVRRMDAPRGRVAGVVGADVAVVAVSRRALAGVRAGAVLAQRTEIGVHAVRVAVAAAADGRVLAAGRGGAGVGGAGVVVVAVGRRAGLTDAGAAALAAVAAVAVAAARAVDHRRVHASHRGDAAVLRARVVVLAAPWVAGAATGDASFVHRTDV